MKKTLFLLVVILLFSTTTVYAKENLSLTAEELTLDINEKYDININNKIRGSKYYWYSSNTDVISINPRNGIAKALNGGIVDVYCEITLPNKDIIKLHCPVEVTPLFFENEYMAHAGGGYEGNIYNNTEEAIINSLDNGFRFMEVDMTLTADNKLVCSHGWDKNTCKATGIEYLDKTPTYDEFMGWKIQGKYKTIDASTVISCMREYPDLLVEVDLKKFGQAKTKRMIYQLVNLANNDETILDRILMQFTSEEAFFAIEEIYHFKYYQYFTYKSKIVKELDNVIKFCKDNEVTSIAVNYTVLTSDMIKQIKDNGFYLLAFTIDDKEIAGEYLTKGVDSICTNHLK